MSFPPFKIHWFSKSFINHSPVAWFTALCCLCVVSVSVVKITRAALSTETHSSPTLRRPLTIFAASPQGPDLDYSNFKIPPKEHSAVSYNSIIILFRQKVYWCMTWLSMSKDMLLTRMYSILLILVPVRSILILPLPSQQLLTYGLVLKHCAMLCSSRR